MSGGVVAYVERDLGGAVIKRVRLVAAGLDRSWTAPEPTAISSSAGTGPGAAVSGVKAAARWIVEGLGGVGLKRLANVCVDAEGSVCAWLSAPSPDRQVIEASIQEAALDAGAGDGAGLGAGRLLAMASPSGGGGLGLTSETSLQALAAAGSNGQVEAGTKAGGRLALGSGGRKPATSALGKKHRYAVLAVPDAPVRVLLDELDAMGIEVESVSSIWHAIAQAMDTARPGAMAQSTDAAAVVIDPAGKLIWSWSQGGELVAGGTMRLSASVRRESAAAETGALAGVEGAARRVTDSGTGVFGEAGATQTVHEVSDAESGRLALDWLAWSAQLGHCPQRVVCIATRNLTGPGGEGAAALGHAVAKAWPGAMIDTASSDDPIGAALARLAGLGTDRAPAPAALPAGARTALLPLANRPGRSDRGMYRWAAISLIAAAGAVGALGWRLYEAAGAAQAVRVSDKLKRDEVLASLDGVIPNLSKERVPKDAMQAKLKQLQEQAQRIRAPRPVLEETVRIFRALEGARDIKMTEFDINAVLSAQMRLVVPDAEAGPAILEKLKSSPGQLPWEGTIPRFDSGTRTYLLTAMWPKDEQAGGSR